MRRILYSDFKMNERENILMDEEDKVISGHT
jgi:hypothetical protein